MAKRRSFEEQAPGPYPPAATFEVPAPAVPMVTTMMTPAAPAPAEPAPAEPIAPEPAPTASAPTPLVVVVRDPYFEIPAETLARLAEQIERDTAAVQAGKSTRQYLASYYAGRLHGIRMALHALGHKDFYARVSVPEEK